MCRPDTYCLSLARIKSDGTVRYYQQDALGSVIALTDDTGAVKTTYSYDPFGNVTISGEPSDNPFQYTGRENDGTGLYYYRARYYSPELQRFISEDPILRPLFLQDVLGGTMSQKFVWAIRGLIYDARKLYSYVYALNNPAMNIDPLGLVTTGGGMSGAAVLGGGVGMQVQIVCTPTNSCKPKCCVVWSLCACVGVGLGVSGNFTYCSQTITSCGNWGGGLTVGLGPISGSGGGGCYTVGAGPGIPIQAYYCWCMCRSSCEQ